MGQSRITFIVITGLVVSVVIQVRLTIHICTVEHNAQQRRIRAFQLLHRIEHHLAGRLAAMHHQHAAVAVAGNVQRVGHIAQRRRIHQDIGEVLRAVFQHLGKMRAFQQNGRVRDGRRYRDHVAVGHVGLIDHVLDLGLARQIVGHPHQLLVPQNADPVLAAHLGVAQVAVDQDGRRTHLRDHLPQLHGHKALALIGHAAGHHDGLDLVAAEAQIDPQLVERFAHVEGKVRDLMELKFFHFVSFLSNSFFFLWALKSPRSPSGMTARGWTPRYLTTSSGVTKVSFIR